MRIAQKKALDLNLIRFAMTRIAIAIAATMLFVKNISKTFGIPSTPKNQGARGQIIRGSGPLNLRCRSESGHPM